MCVRLVRAAAATARRKRESDAMGRTGNPALTAVPFAPARYRKRTHSHKANAPLRDLNPGFSSEL